MELEMQFREMVIKKEIKEALAMKQAVVALESTIISHGMPYPQNVETAKLLEKTVRDNGGIPATIAIISGVVKIGLDDQDLEFLGTSRDIRKASRRDLPTVVALKQSAATTVSATMICAHLAGIRFLRLAALAVCTVAPVRPSIFRPICPSLHTPVLVSVQEQRPFSIFLSPWNTSKPWECRCLVTDRRNARVLLSLQWRQGAAKSRKCR